MIQDARSHEIKVKEYVRSVQVYMKAEQQTDFSNPIFFHHIWLGCWPRFIKERSSRAAEIFGSADKGSSVVHDVALPHFILSFWEFSNNVFPEQWIRKGWPTVGPVPSVELNLLDFYLWGHLKSTVFDSEVNDV
jgi:hypothetical protein